MKQYGFNKATSFTKKQVGVIYAKAKAGDLHLEKWLVSRLYDLADYYGHDDNGSVEYEERFIRVALEELFAGDLEACQRKLDQYSDHCLSCFTEKKIASLDRNIVC